MTADIIVGSGWPFGGRFLKPAEQTKRVRLVKKEVDGPTVFEASLAELAGSGAKEREEVEAPPRARLPAARVRRAGRTSSRSGAGAERRGGAVESA